MKLKTAIVWLIGVALLAPGLASAAGTDTEMYVINRMGLDNLIIMVATVDTDPDYQGAKMVMPNHTALLVHMDDAPYQSRSTNTYTVRLHYKDQTEPFAKVVFTVVNHFVTLPVTIESIEVVSTTGPVTAKTDIEEHNFSKSAQIVITAKED